MDIINAIEKRISRRSYLTTPIDQDKLGVIEQKLAEVNAISGLTCTFVADGSTAFAGGKSYGMFSGVKSLIVLKGDKDLPDLKEKVGYYGELLILEATSLDLGTCWVGGTFDKDLIAAAENEEIICVVPVGNVNVKSTLKESFIRSTIRRKTKDISEMLQTDGEIDGRLQRAMELVQLAPTTRNTQKVMFMVKEGVITASVPDDSTFDLVDLGICKLHFEAGYGGKFQLGNGVKLHEE